MEREALATVWVDGVDPVTGVAGRIPVLVGKRVRWKERYLFVFQAMWYRLVTDRRMTGERLRVLGMLMGRCDWENWLYIRQRDLAEDAGMHVNQVSRALQYLVRTGLVLRGPRIGRAHAYRLNSHYVYKGKLVNLAQHRRREHQQ